MMNDRDEPRSTEFGGDSDLGGSEEGELTPDEGWIEGERSLQAFAEYGLARRDELEPRRPRRLAPALEFIVWVGPDGWISGCQGILTGDRNTSHMPATQPLATQVQTN